MSTPKKPTLPQSYLDKKNKDPNNIEVEVRFGTESFLVYSRLYNNVIKLITEKFANKEIITEDSTVYRYTNDLRQINTTSKSTKTIITEGKNKGITEKENDDFEKEYYELKLQLEEPYRSPDYPFKAVLSSEKRRTDKPKGNPIATIERRRTSIIPLDKKGRRTSVRYDFTVATESSTKGSNRLSYRIELEIMNDIDLEDLEDNYLKPLLHYVLESPILITNSDYSSLKSNMVDIEVDKPKDLLFQHMQKDKGGDLTKDRYLVTIKTDGIRKLLLFHKKSIYLVGVHGNNLFSYAMIMYSEKLAPLDGYLLDVEYVPTDSSDILSFYEEDTIYTCYCFDIIRYPDEKGKLIYTGSDNNRGRQGVPFLIGTLVEPEECRYTVLSRFVEDVKIAKIPLIMKEYRMCDTPENFFLSCKETLEEEYDFETDGLIFVNGDKPYVVNVAYDRCRDKPVWESYTKKWKPKEKLTNDFLYKDGKLYLGNGEEFKGTIAFPWNGKFVTELDGEELIEGVVVEFKSELEDENNPDSDILIPTRIRDDKEKASGKRAVEDVWRLIHDPIYEDTLKGESFQLQKKAQNTAKSRIIFNIPPFFKVADIGAGQGGDIKKQETARLNVYAIEPNKDMLKIYRERLATFGYSRIEEEKKESKKEKKGSKKKEEKYRAKNGSQITILPYGGQDERIKDIGHKINVITSFHSITFFKDDDLDDLLTNWSKILVKGGILYLTGLDAFRLSEIVGTNYEGKALNFSLDGEDVRIRLSGTLVDQEEFAINWNELSKKLEAKGFHIEEEGFINEERWMSNEELAYEDSTRYIRATFNGTDSEIVTLTELLPLPEPPSVNTLEIMDKKGDVIIKAEGLPPLPVREDSVLTGILKVDEQRKFRHNNYELVRIGVLGANDCLLHALCRALSKTYEKLPLNGRLNFVRDMRGELADELTEEDFKQLGHGQLSATGMYTYASYKKLLRAQEPLGDEVIDLLEKKFEVNITMVWYLKDKGFIAGIANGDLKRYKKNIILINWNNYHYETVGYEGKNDNGKTQLYTAFIPNHKVIRAMETEANLIKKEREKEANRKIIIQQQ